MAAKIETVSEKELQKMSDADVEALRIQFADHAEKIKAYRTVLARECERRQNKPKTGSK